MNLKKQSENEQLIKIYTGMNKDEYIYRDRRDSKLFKLIKYVVAFAISILPIIGPVIEAILKFTV